MIVMHFLRLELKTGRNFEAVQSYLGLFLKIHGETVAEEEVNVLLLPPKLQRRGLVFERKLVTMERV